MSNYFSVLFTKHKKHLPKPFKGTWFEEICRYGVMIFISAWVLQGMRIMNWRETVLKLLLDVVIMALLIGVGCYWLLAFVIAHTLNFTFNGQLFAMFTHMGATNVPPQRFLMQTEHIARKAQKSPCIAAAIAYGSLSRGCYKRTSDIDLRIIPAMGEWNWWCCVLWAFGQRCIAFIERYPLDMYVYSADEVIKRMRTDELPVMLCERRYCMKDYYPNRVEFNEFKERFIINNIR